MSRYEYDVILVLGCGIDRSGALDPDAVKSVETAVDLFSQYKAPRMIMTGCVTYAADFIPAISEAQAMKDYAISLGIPNDTIFVETESRDSTGNFYFTKVNLLQPLHLKKLLVVRGPNQTSERMEYLMARILGPGYTFKLVPRNTEFRPGELERNQKSQAIAASYLEKIEPGDDDAMYKLIREIHPAYKFRTIKTSD